MNKRRPFSFAKWLSHTASKGISLVMLQGLYSRFHFKSLLNGPLLTDCFLSCARISFKSQICGFQLMDRVAALWPAGFMASGRPHIHSFYLVPLLSVACQHGNQSSMPRTSQVYAKLWSEEFSFCFGPQKNENSPSLPLLFMYSWRVKWGVDLLLCWIVVLWWVVHYWSHRKGLACLP